VRALWIDMGRSFLMCASRGDERRGRLRTVAVVPDGGSGGAHTRLLGAPRMWGIATESPSPAP
jgi:hypothetical protein